MLIRSALVFLVALATVAGALLVGGNGEAHAYGCGYGNDDAYTAVPAVWSPYGNTMIELRYSVQAGDCAWGRETGPIGSEVRTDRTLANGTYQGFLHYATITSGSWANTKPDFDDGNIMRACGTSAEGRAIVCTGWY